jgi:hypothetical protein
MSQGLPDYIKSQFVDNVESTPWGAFIEAMLNGRSMEDPEVQELHQSKDFGLQLLLL